MKEKFTRRRFLQVLAITTSAFTLQSLTTACSSQPNQTEQEVEPTFIDATSQEETSPDPTPLSDSTITNQPAQSPLNTDIEPSQESIIDNTDFDLVVARRGEPEDLVRQAIATLGGMKRFVKPGNKVIIKPNICNAYNTYEYASTTNPWVVSSLVKLCLEAGASKVTVLDFPFAGDSKEAYIRSGIQEQVLAAGGKMETISDIKFKETEVPKGKDLNRIGVYDEVFKADTLINVPIAKHHSSAKLTLGMKNLMGLIDDRGSIHFNLGQRIADLASLITPTLTVIDAVRILMDNGPTGGSLDDVQKLDTIIAGTDIVAADSYACTLFNKKPDDLDYVRAAAVMKLGKNDLGEIRIKEIILEQ
jgi:uncharacterized protein (DUF362 family)